MTLGPTRRSLGVQHARDAALARIRARAASSDPGILVVDEIASFGSTTLRIRRYRPRQTTPSSVALYLHGGGWVTGDLDINDHVCRSTARLAGCEVVSLDYPLAPEHPFPAALEQASEALRWLASWTDGPPSVLGLSAGGAIAAALAYRAGSGSLPPVAHLPLLCPVLDSDFHRSSYGQNAHAPVLTTDDMRWFWDLYLPDVALRADPDASPLRSPHLERFPPTSIVAAGIDPLRDEAVEFEALLSAAGVDVQAVVVPEATHGFMATPGDAAGAEALRWLAARLPGG